MGWTKSTPFQRRLRVAAADHRQHVLKLNVGCGLDAVPGWENLDNSWSLVVSSHGLLRVGFDILERVTQRRPYARFPAGVRRHDVTKGLPYPSESVAAIYSSHMLEHLPRRDVERFLREAYWVLVPGGCYGWLFPIWNARPALLLHLSSRCDRVVTQHVCLRMNSSGAPS
jgi:SAM-dependent methyltransferase